MFREPTDTYIGMSLLKTNANRKDNILVWNYHSPPNDFSILDYENKSHFAKPSKKQEIKESLLVKRNKPSLNRKADCLTL